MTPRYRIVEHRDLVHAPEDEFAAEVLLGLSRTPKALPSRFFYDDRGSALFTRITTLEAYYLTRCELDILETRGAEIARFAGEGPYNLVELGAGDGTKTSVLLQALLSNGASLRYSPIDISEAAMRALVTELGPRFASLEIAGFVCDYFTGLHLLKRQKRRNFVLFLGSNIGNFAADATDTFLQRLWSALNPGDLVLIGFDLKKDIAVLRQAYADPEGVTAEFNLNLLDRMNRELGATFAREKFRHYAAYNFRQGAMESFLVSLESQTVEIAALRRAFDFEAWEPIHTECSAKYSRAQIEHLAQANGFEVLSHFHDGRGWFCDSLWRVRKDLR